MKRYTVDIQHIGACNTPWGKPDFATEYASGIVFYSTPGHGGFWVNPERRAMMSEPYRSHPPFCGQAGWYEEDCDWAVVALAFPQFFTESELSDARCMWAWMQERKISDAQAKLKTSAALRCQDFNEADCGGVFDGNQVVSDADPGL